jgi:FKBP-type peptidyl-prolyl cis-trans isomerase FkpA
MKKVLIVSMALLVLIYSCTKTSSPPPCDPNYNECWAIAPQYEIDSVIKYLSDSAITDTVRHCTGMFYKIDTVGTGRTPDVCSTITIKYKGQLKNGTVFDQANNLTYPLGQFIVGFKNGIIKMKEGGTIHLYIPPALAYGSRSLDKIPSNSMLIFEVKLLSVQ